METGATPLSHKHGPRERIGFSRVLVEFRAVRREANDSPHAMKTIAPFQIRFAALGLAFLFAAADRHAVAQSFFLQPGPTGPKDTSVTEQDDFAHDGWGVRQANQDQFQQRVLIQFDLSGIAGPVTSAYLGLYRFEAFSGDDMTLNTHAITETSNPNVGWSTQPESSSAVAASAQVTGTASV